MFSIGEFSKITGLTVKTLRFYHERGLLVPARVETGSGYRNYDQRNLDTARTIVALRKYGFTLDQIVEILQDHADGLVSGLREHSTSIIFLAYVKLALQLA